MTADERRAALVEKVEKRGAITVWDAIDLALEEAAKVAEKSVTEVFGREPVWMSPKAIAAAIRAMKGEA
jgi:hypothetical protein